MDSSVWNIQHIFILTTMYTLFGLHIRYKLFCSKYEPAFTLYRRKQRLIQRALVLSAMESIIAKSASIFLLTNMHTIFRADISWKPYLLISISEK